MASLDDLQPEEEFVPEDEPLEDERHALLPRVQDLLARILDNEERTRFERFFAKAAAAIQRIGEMKVDPSQYEDHLEGNLWDIVEPGFNATLECVNDFLDVVRTAFPVEEPSAGDDLDLDDIDFGDTKSEEKDEEEEPQDRLQEVGKILQAISSNMSHELRTIEEALETLAKTKDRWNLLETLGEFRGRSRAGIGEMVFLAARLFAVVRKEDVVPYYREDIENSLHLRGQVTDLRDKIVVHRTRLERLDVSTEHDAARESIERCVADVGEFMKTDTYQSMRAANQRSFHETRDDLSDLAQSENIGRKRIDTLLEGLARFLESLAVINQREILVVHDQETAGTIRHYVTQTTNAVASYEVEPARNALHQAFSNAEKLYGRDPTFDSFVKLLRHVEVSKLQLSDLLGMAQFLGELVPIRERSF